MVSMLGVHEQIEMDRARALPGAKDIQDFREYYRGRQRGTHTPAQARYLRGVLGHLFCDNVCRKIINEAASRHVLTGWRVESDAVAEALDGLWVRNQLPAMQTAVGIAALRDGNTAVSLRWQTNDPARPSLGRVTLHRERWWDGKHGVFVAYGTDGEPAYAVRDWEEATGATVTQRRTIYFPDHLERYILQGDGWKPHALASDPDASGIVPWVKRDGRPLGIPIIHFAYGSDDDGRYGASDLDGGVLGVQDEINDVQRDITATARLTGYQMYWATGSEPERDAAGNRKPLLVGPGQMLQSPSAETRYGVLPAGDLSKLHDALMTKITTACRMTDTPLHVITGQWPSGTALLRAEMPLVAKVTRLNNQLGPAWATVAHRATEMLNTFGEGERLDEGALITTEWAPPEQLDALTLAQIDLARANALIARETLQDESSLVAMGMTEQEATAMLARRQQRADLLETYLGGVTSQRSAGT